MDHILPLWLEIWRINYDADLTPFPCVEAVWPGMFGLLEILALLRLHPPPPQPPHPDFELVAAAGVTTNKLPRGERNGQRHRARLWLQRNSRGLSQCVRL